MANRKDNTHLFHALIPPEQNNPKKRLSQETVDSNKSSFFQFAAPKGVYKKPYG